MPESPSHALIQQAYRTGSPALAAELAERFLREHPGHPPVLVVLAQASEELHRFDRARTAYGELERLLGPSVGLFNSRGAVEAAAGDGQAAAGFFQQAAALAPSDARPKVHLSAMAARRGDLEGALIYATEATACTEGPLDEAWFTHGLVLRSLGRYLEASASFERALQITADYPEARRLRADVIAAAAVTG